MCLFSSISMVFASQETRLNIAYPVLLNSPSIYGNYVTWSDEHGNSPIAYDLKARKEINIPSPDSMGGKVPMYGNNIVWSLHGGDIALYNVATKQTTIIPAGFSPSIYGNIVAYEGNSGIYTYDVSSKKNTQTSTSGTDPRIYGNNIVYVDNDQIYIYNISTKQRSLIGNINDQDHYYDNVVDINGNVVVWVYMENIYMRDISAHKTTQMSLCQSLD